MVVSQVAFYNLKRKFGGISMTELCRLKQLEKENRTSFTSIFTSKRM